MIIILFEYDITIVVYIIIFTRGNIKFRLIILLYIVKKKKKIWKLLFWISAINNRVNYYSVDSNNLE